MSRQVHIGGIPIGGGAPVAVQTMTNTDTCDVESTLNQIKNVCETGAELVRLAVPDEKAAAALKEITADSPLPIIADIHFDWRLAIESLKAGVKALRINPGNIGGHDKVRQVAQAAGNYGAVIRVGVNSGSLEKELLAKHGGHPNAEAMVESAALQVAILKESGFNNIKVSLKSSSVMETVAAARLWNERYDEPQHLGVTEAGDVLSGAIKSSMGLGILLSEGIGDTIRVSLTGPPEEEVRVAWEILRAAGLRSRGVEVISCPSCGRTEGPLLDLSAEIKKRLSHIIKPLKIAVMGCVVNGPGEAREADVGVALGRDCGLIFARGKPLKKVSQQKIIEALEEEIKNML